MSIRETLEKSFFDDKKILAREVFLTQVMRQNNNLILENAMSIRKCIENPNHKELKFQFDEDSCINFNNNSCI